MLYHTLFHNSEFCELGTTEYSKSMPNDCSEVRLELQSKRIYYQLFYN